ncbi:MAG: hypothetical protein WD609_03200, partial [Aquisalimonadaceae bacterium]
MTRQTAGECNPQGASDLFPWALRSHRRALARRRSQAMAVALGKNANAVQCTPMTALGIESWLNAACPS